jgi:hypothetical protein
MPLVGRVRRASSRVSSFAADSPSGLVLELQISRRC